MIHENHRIKHFKYITLLNVRVIRLIHENKIERAKALHQFKEYIKKQTDYKRTIT